MCSMLKPYALRLPTVMQVLWLEAYHKCTPHFTVWCLFIAACVDASRTVFQDRSTDPLSNGFIEWHIQMVKTMLSKSSNTWSFQEVLADLRTTRIRAGLPSPTEIPHRRKLTMKAQAEIHCCRRCCLMTRVGEPRRQGRWCWVKGAMS